MEGRFFITSTTWEAPNTVALVIIASTLMQGFLCAYTLQCMADMIFPNLEFKKEWGEEAFKSQRRLRATELGLQLLFSIVVILMQK